MKIISSILLSLFILITTQSFQHTNTVHASAIKQTKHDHIIKKYYTVKEINKSTMFAILNSNHKEGILLFKADQVHKQHFKINDKVVVYFKPYKDSYMLLDFKKVNK